VVPATFLPIPMIVLSSYGYKNLEKPGILSSPYFLGLLG